MYSFLPDEVAAVLCRLTLGTDARDRKDAEEALWHLQRNQANQHNLPCYRTLWRVLQALTAAHYNDKEGS